MTDTPHSPKQQNGNILCAQIAMILHGATYAVTCRAQEIHIQLNNYTGTLQIQNWKNMSFLELREYIEMHLE